MDVTLRQQGAWMIVTLETSRLDASNAPGLRRTLQEAVPRGGTSLVFDLSRAELVDSSGLGLLVSCRQWIRPEDQVVLVGVQPAVAMILRHSHLDRVFPVAPSVAAVLAATGTLVPG